MADVKICPVCKLPVDQKEVMGMLRDEWPDLGAQVDYYGVESLTEQEQVLYLRECHFDCFEHLK